MMMRLTIILFLGVSTLVSSTNLRSRQTSMRRFLGEFPLADTECDRMYGCSCEGESFAWPKDSENICLSVSLALFQDERNMMHGPFPGVCPCPRHSESNVVVREVPCDLCMFNLERQLLDGKKNNQGLKYNKVYDICDGDYKNCDQKLPERSKTVDISDWKWAGVSGEISWSTNARKNIASGCFKKVGEKDPSDLNREQRFQIRGWEFNLGDNTERSTKGLNSKMDSKASAVSRWGHYSGYATIDGTIATGLTGKQGKHNEVITMNPPSSKTCWGDIQRFSKYTANWVPKGNGKLSITKSNTYGEEMAKSFELGLGASVGIEFGGFSASVEASATWGSEAIHALEKSSEINCEVECPSPSPGESDPYDIYLFEVLSKSTWISDRDQPIVEIPASCHYMCIKPGNPPPKCPPGYCDPTYGSCDCCVSNDWASEEQKKSGKLPPICVEN